MKLLAATALVLAMIPLQPASGQEPTPAHQLTSRGVISFDAGQAYKEAIESCYHGTPGNKPSGPRFLACLKQQVRTQGAALDAAYKGTLASLGSSPKQAADLRAAQALWLQFRDANCAFARAVAPRAEADEFFNDCVLMSTIERRVELRSLVGD